MDNSSNTCYNFINGISMIHAMIDLETLSTEPDAVILTVGGVKFDPYTPVSYTHLTLPPICSV